MTGYNRPDILLIARKTITQSGALLLDDKRISIKDLAKITGYSVATVSRVLNNKEGKYSEKTKEKVLAAIEETNYETNSIAKSLRVRKTNTIAVVIPDLSNSFFARLVQEIETLLFSNGFTLIICTTDRKQEKEDQYLKMLEGKMVDGVIMISGNDDLTSSNYFKGKPIVFIDRGIQDEESVSLIGSNHYQGGKLAAQKLFDDKCKKIAFITQDKNLQINKEIFRGAKELLTKQEILFDNSAIVNVTSDDKFSKTGATTSTINELIYERNFNYDGAICTDDRVAVGAILALKKYGKVIPKDFKIIGYGNDPISKYFTPALTSIRQDYALLAKESVKELFYRIEEEAERVAHTITIPVSLVNRQTTI